MKYPEKNIEFKISQLDFILTPLEISFNKTEAHTYALELCKGTPLFTQVRRFIKNSTNIFGYTPIRGLTSS